MSRAIVVRAVIGLCFAAASTTLYAAPLPYEAGEKWKITSSVVGSGMSMPGQTQEVCMAKGSTEAPKPPQQQGCTFTNRQRVGNVDKMHMHCDTKDGAMDADMEMESLGPDHWRQKMHITSQQGSVDMAMDSRKLPGTCDVSEMKNKVAAMEAQAKQNQAKAQQEMAETCHKAARDLNAELFTYSPPACSDAGDKAVMCRTLQSYDGFTRHSPSARANAANPAVANATEKFEKIASFCGVKTVNVRATLCASAQHDKQWQYFAEQCPAVSDKLGKAHCQDRTFSPPHIDAEWEDFCKAWFAAKSADPDEAGASDDGGGSGGGAGAAGGNGKTAKEAPPKTSTADKAKEALQKGKDKLKGLFKF